MRAFTEIYLDLAFMTCVNVYSIAYTNLSTVIASLVMISLGVSYNFRS